MKIKVKVIPGSKEQGIEEIEREDIDYKIKLISRPQKGKANKELIEFLSNHFKVPKYRVKLLDGYKSRIKTLEIS